MSEMSEKRRRRRFTANFKARVAIEDIEGAYTLAELAGLRLRSAFDFAQADEAHTE